MRHLFIEKNKETDHIGIQEKKRDKNFMYVVLFLLFVPLLTQNTFFLPALAAEI